MENEKQDQQISISSWAAGLDLDTLLYCLSRSRFPSRSGEWGFINPMAKWDYEALVVTLCLCLEQTQAIYYYGSTKDGSQLGNVAGFFFPDFLWMDNKYKFQVANPFLVEIDLDTNKIVNAKLGKVGWYGPKCQGSCDFAVVWYNTIAAQHVM